MSCCDRGCEPCFSYFVRTGGHFSECCSGFSCCGSYGERQEAKRMRERAVANQCADAAQDAKDLLQKLTLAVATVEVEMRVMQGKAESARDQLRRLAQQQREEEEAEGTRAAIEARLAERKNRQLDAQVSKQPEPEKPREQKPKVVHVKAADARPVVTHQKVSQT